LLAHYVGDIHQPLHVGAVYIDSAGNVVDPDSGTFDSITKTTGGNDLYLDQPAPRKKPRNLHHEWDTVRGAVVGMPVPAVVLDEASRVEPTPGSLEQWDVVWASESVVLSKDAFRDLAYEALDEKAKHYLVTLPEGYGGARNQVQRKRVIQAGARLAQILNAIWP
jgi:S1/P1 Nuclease